MRWISFVVIMFLSATASAAGAVPVQAPVGEMVEGIACASDPTQTYTLYLPQEFDASKQWPVLLIFDPRGRSVLAAELFREAADTYGWILVSSDNTRSDGPMEPNLVALRALWPEVHTRLPARFDRIYTAGLSGGVAIAYVLSRSTHEVAGMIACCGRYFADELKDSDVPIFSTTGDTDYNYHEMHDVDRALAKKDIPHRLVVFEGPHTWMPPALAEEAVAWFELLAMKSDTTARDPDGIEALYAEELDRARGLESDGQLVAAVRRYREMAATFEGLFDTTSARDAAARLEKNPGLRRQEKNLKKWNAFERNYLGEMNSYFYELRNAEIAPAPAYLTRGFRIDELQRRAQEPGIEGVTARRALNALSTGLNFYVARDLIAAGQYDRLAVCLEVGLQVRKDSAAGWYNLACARAQLSREDAAIEALEKALDLGFTRHELLATDTDLDPLRDREDFKALLAGTAEETAQ